MKIYRVNEIKEKIREIGIKKDDTIFINPETYKLGILENINFHNKVYECFYNVIKEIIGPKGTISINSYSFETLRHLKRFNYNSTKTTCGGFSNYILSLKQTVRSNHPVFSVSSIGYNSKFISQGNSLSNYGYSSPYEKFLRLNGKILSLGRNYWDNPYNHVAEFMIGVPYYYNKFTNVPIIKNKKKIKKEYSSFVRYMNFELISDYKKLKLELKKSKIIKSAKLGDDFVHSVNAKKYLEICLKLLSKNQFCFINKKKYLRSNLS